MKVVLIDDEPLALVGIRSMIAWEQSGFQIVGEARDGEAGLQIIRETRPDIVVADIVMPRMDGLEMARKVRETLPECRVILLSCMRDAEHYERAIQLGVSRYIQKESVSAAQLLEAVSGVADEIRSERVLDEAEDRAFIQNDNLVKSEFLNLVLKGGITDAIHIGRKLCDWRMIRPDAPLTLALLRVDRINEEERDDAFLDYSVINLCQQIVGSACGGFVFRCHDGRLGALLNTADPGALSRLFARMRETAEQCVDCVLTMGCSAPIERLDALPGAYRQAGEAAELGFFHGLGKLYFEGTGSARGAQGDGEPDARPSAGWSEQLDGLAAWLRQGAVSAREARARLLSLLYRSPPKGGADDLSRAVSVVERAGTLEQAAQAVREALSSPGASGLSGTNLARDVETYVDQHLHGKIKLEALAKSVYLSPSYLCRLFKKQTGENLSEFILRKKMEEARQLLGAHTVGEVSDIMGYHSHSHFIRVFREHMGVTPSQYQKRKQQ